MRDQETDRGARGNLSQLLVDLPLNRSRSSQLSCLGSGIPSLVGGEREDGLDREAMPMPLLYR